MYLSMIRIKDGSKMSAEDKFKLAMQMAKTRNRYGDMQNEENVHRMICDMAGGCKRSDKNLLYIKIDSMAETLYIQSDGPLVSSVVESLGYRFEYPPIDLSRTVENFKVGDKVFIRTKLAPVEKNNATKTVHSLAYVPDGEKKRREWIARNAKRNGFRVLSMQEGLCSHICWDKSKKGTRAHNSWTNAFYYTGVVEVTNPEAFKKAITEGIGKYKAYGCGLIIASAAA